MHRGLAGRTWLAAGLLLVGCVVAGCADPRDGSYLEVEVAAAVCERPPEGAMDTRCSHVLPKDAIIRVYDGTQVVGTGNPEDGDYRLRLEPGTYRVVASAFLFGVARHTAIVASGHTTTVRLHLAPIPVTAPPEPATGA